MNARRAISVGAALLLVSAAVSCGSSGDPDGGSGGDGKPGAALDHTPAHAVEAKIPLRDGERFQFLSMERPYTPAPPSGGTDEYRCFLLDPHFTGNTWIVGSEFLPENADIVHHAILFRVQSRDVEAAQKVDDESPGDGWTCFGDEGIRRDGLGSTGWIGSWAPGGTERLINAKVGFEMAAGSRIVMQVHYNLLKGDQPDLSSTQIRWTPKAGSDIRAVHTTLLPAPVELPCRSEHALGALCDREASVEDAKERFGEDTGQLANLLHLLCGTDVYATSTTSCTREIPRSMTILGAAGHMHLLGQWIRIEANPGTPDATEVLDIPLWNFDDQGAQRIEPLHVDAGDSLRVTCHHSQELRDLLPAFEGTQEKYVVWGEGTTDEMCLGILQVVFDDGS
jgi:Copper type II ascorbate-dependent monooxygenase, N-terminal domain